jgi:membrane fusion protein (multidrug efflux system)
MTSATTADFEEGAKSGATEVNKTRSRRRALLYAGPLALVLAGAGWWIMGGRYETTENAYLHQARISVAPSVGGRVTDVLVADNQKVKAGTVLFKVDPVPYQLALAEADAAVARARLGVEQLKVAYGQAQSQERLAEDDAAYQTNERERQESLGSKGVATGSTLDDARYAERRAIDQKLLAEQAGANALAALGGKADIKTDDHPSVKSALVARDQALYNLNNATVTAPADGIIYQASSFKPGQMVAAGQAVFALVETGDVWVEANFKETQLQGIEVGQPAEVSFDADPSRKVQATVEAIGAGTGAEFSLLPAQNATGNWVKVTQRVPVRLRLADAEASAGLSSGVSASVSVDTGRSNSLRDLLPASIGGK